MEDLVEILANSSISIIEAEQNNTELFVSLIIVIEWSYCMPCHAVTLLECLLCIMQWHYTTNFSGGGNRHNTEDYKLVVR